MIYESKLVSRPSLPAGDIASLRLEEARLLQERANEILCIPRARMSDDRTQKLLAEESRLLDLAPEGIQGWNVFSGISPSIVIVGQNPFLMSYVESQAEVIAGFSGPDRRALWLATGCVLGLQGEIEMNYRIWKANVFDSGRWLQLMKKVIFINAISYRYYVLESEVIRTVKSLKRGYLNLGSNTGVLDSLSHEILLSVLGMPSVRAVIVAHRDTALRLSKVVQHAPETTPLSRRVHFVGCSHWVNTDCWKDFPEIMRIMRVAQLREIPTT